MSLKSRLRRLEAGVRWLETEGAILAQEWKLKLLDTLQRLSDHTADDPSYREGWNKRLPLVQLPPPRVKPRAPPMPKPAPVVAPVVAPVRTDAPSPPPSTPKPSPPPAPRPAPVGGFHVEPAMEIAPVFWRKPGERDPRDG